MGDERWGGNEMRAVKGNVSAQVYVDCPHCEATQDLMEGHDDEERLSKALFGGPTTPARWDDLDIAFTCAK
jgi:hypothetical protein